MLTKSLFVAFIVASILSFAPLAALGQESLPTGKELIAKAAKAFGDPQDLQKVRSLQMEGKVILGLEVAQPNVDITAKLIKLKGKKGKTVISIRENAIESFSNETHAWTKNRGRVDRLPDTNLRSVQLMNALFAPLELDHFFDQYTAVRETKFDSQPCYAVECSKDTKRIATFYFAKDTGLEIGFEMDEPEFTQIYRDYKQVDGIMVAHQIEFQNEGQTPQTLIVEKVAFNVEVEEKQFETPDSIK